MLQSMHLASFRQYFPSPRRAPVGTQVSPHIPDRLWEFRLAPVRVNCTRGAAPQRSSTKGAARLRVETGTQGTHVLPWGMNSVP